MSIAVQKIRYEVGWTENEKGLVLVSLANNL